jgi:hypothetical protein
MTISEEESNYVCACHLFNCDEGSNDQSRAFGTLVNGARQKKSEPSRVHYESF